MSTGCSGCGVLVLRDLGSQVSGFRALCIWLRFQQQYRVPGSRIQGTALHCIFCNHPPSQAFFMLMPYVSMSLYTADRR